MHPECSCARPGAALDIRAMSVRQVAAAIGISRSKIYQEIGADRLRAIKVDGRTLIRVSDLDEYLATRPALNSASKRATSDPLKQDPSRPTASADMNAGSGRRRSPVAARNPDDDVTQFLAALRGDKDCRRLFAGDRDRLNAVIDILRRLLERGNV